LKKSEDDDDWILRIVEIAGEAKKVSVSFDRKINSMYEVNLIEDLICRVESSKNQFEFEIKPFEIRSFKGCLK
jgi:alpha-mannosidase